MVVKGEEPVRRLADDDHAVGRGRLAGEGQDLEALVERQVLEHRVEQEDVDLAGSRGDGGDDLARGVVVQLDVRGAALGDETPAVGDVLGLDVHPDHSLGTLRERAAHRAVTAAVLENVAPVSGKVCSTQGTRKSRARRSRLIALFGSSPQNGSSAVKPGSVGAA